MWCCLGGTRNSRVGQEKPGDGCPAFLWHLPVLLRICPVLEARALVHCSKALFKGFASVCGPGLPRVGWMLWELNRGWPRRAELYLPPAALRAAAARLQPPALSPVLSASPSASPSPLSQQQHPLDWTPSVGIPVLTPRIHSPRPNTAPPRTQVFKSTGVDLWAARQPWNCLRSGPMAFQHLPGTLPWRCVRGSRARCYLP